MGSSVGSWYPNNYEYPNHTRYPRNKTPIVSTMAIRNGINPGSKLVNGKLIIVHKKRIKFAVPDRPPSLFPSKNLFPRKDLFPYKEV